MSIPIQTRWRLARSLINSAFFSSHAYGSNSPTPQVEVNKRTVLLEAIDHSPSPFHPRSDTSAKKLHCFPLTVQHRQRFWPARLFRMLNNRKNGLPISVREIRSRVDQSSSFRCIGPVVGHTIIGTSHITLIQLKSWLVATGLENQRAERDRGANPPSAFVNN